MPFVSDPIPSRHWTPSLRLRLLLLVAATVLPLTAFGALAIIVSDRDGRLAAVERTLFQARALRSAMETLLEGRIGAVVALADHPALRTGDWSDFKPLAEAFLRRQADNATLAVVGPDNRILFDVGYPAPSPPGLRRSDTEATPRLFAEGQPGISNLFRGTRSGRFGFSVDAPVRREDGAIPWYLSVRYDTAALNRLLEHQALPAEWVVAILDRRGVILARRPDPERHVGRPASPDFQPQTARATEGSLRATTVDGVPVSAVYARAPRFGWTVGVGVPDLLLDAPLRGRLEQFILAGTGMLGLSLAGAWLVARHIEDSLRRLATAAPGAPTGLRELDDLAAAVALREAQLRATFLASPVGMAFVDTARRFVEVNDRLAALDGSATLDHRGRLLRDVFGAAAPAFDVPLARVLDAGEAVENLEIRARFAAAPGTPRDLLASMLPVRDAAGRVMGASVALTDITERKRAEERQALLAREVDHRAKNALALAQSVVGLTEARDLPSFAAIVRGRIGALARAHTLLARERWTGAALHDLAEEELATVAAGSVPRRSLDGPRVRLAPGAAQPVAMVLHELSTNALQYGAFARGDGTVTLAWRLAADGGLDLRWEERGGPPLAGPPARLGFGSLLIAETVRRQLEGEVAKQWNPEGLVCLIHLPGWTIGAEEEGAPVPPSAPPR